MQSSKSSVILPPTEVGKTLIGVDEELMREIICPHCGKAFKIDEAGYADIVRQVRNSEFNQELHERLEHAEKEKEAAVALKEAEVSNALKAEASSKDAEIERLKAELAAADVAKSLALEQSVGAIERERDALKQELEVKKLEQQSALELQKAQLEREAVAAITAKESELQELRAKLDSHGLEKQLAVTEAVGTVEKERDELKSKLQQAESERKLGEQSLREKYESQIKDRDQAIERLKDLKAKLSTKMVGETLEQHCEIEFNRIRATAFPRAYFEKDNDARTGSKGDFIFRDYEADGTEIVSIMFEMKNESDGTTTKQRNEDFLKELDKDRTEKKCEYAILVSLLEPESDLYNGGIVDVSHRFPKTYVIRPQFFIPMITLLKNAAMNASQYKAELALVKAQNVDVTNFERDLEEFKTSFGRNYDLASRKFKTAIDEIDKSIDHLQKTRDALVGADRNLRIANDKAQDVTVKKLVRKNPTMTELFKQAQSGGSADEHD